MYGKSTSSGRHSGSAPQIVIILASCFSFENFGIGEVDLLTNTPSGCMDESACNYDSIATQDDGSCILYYSNTIKGCTNPLAKNYNMLTANIHFPLNIESFSAGQNAYFELYGYNLLNEDIYQPEVAGGQINTNPLRSGRSLYLSFTRCYLGLAIFICWPTHRRRF